MKNLEPDAPTTLAIFQSELNFVRTMGNRTPATYALLGLIVAIFLLIALITPFVAASLGDWIIVRLDGQPPGRLRISAELLTLLGSKNNMGILAGEYWRAGTSMLLHGGLLHIAVNGYALYVLGIVLEKLYGTRRYLLLFFMSGLAGAAASYLFTPQNSVGASGAIFGLLGAAVVFGLRFKTVLPARVRRALTRGLLPWVALNVAIGFIYPNIDNAAHMGGLVGGSLIALFLGTPLSRSKTPGAVAFQWVLLTACLCYMAYAVVSGVAHGLGCASSADALGACYEALATASRP